MTRRDHWEDVYRRKAPSEVSWYQPEARQSLDLIQRVASGTDSAIIDVGGGASTLVDGLLDGGYTRIVASFASEGPPRCSGLEVVRYSPDAMHAEFGQGFRLLDSVREDHHTPMGTTQAFVYCLCRYQ